MAALLSLLGVLCKQQRLGSKLKVKALKVKARPNQE